MASYVPFFHPEFIGLTHVDNSENPHLPFEKSLGITAQLIPDSEPGTEPDANNYSVNHGVTLFLINPAGELQAIFQPDTKTPGAHSFDPEIILRDYLAIRDYLG
jgi:protein SCO1/2